MKTILPDAGSYLAEETKAMERRRRLEEQDGHRQLARVNAKNHDEDRPSQEGDLQNSIQQHPFLDNQRLDGADPSVSPAPPLNTEARREYDKQLQLQNELKLKNIHNPNTAPKPQGP